ncbi:hypothetical protein HELRODRAFT_185875 [Helobdella robusta]|uniref:3-hydroxyacyl-CoA dehydrogenase n=1 Tax=Helobdella robusta TaxID=6412 RepID=T1FND8_HELRO|nr:hypothetical protein HELRODRAFT_185875 [Helobdella robusta]ESN98124.1 hypothetical protein HELRODRAFT_185875 [Helobdella robusta]
MSFATKLINRHFSTGIKLSNKNVIIKNVTVIGGGIMGGGIAQVAAQTGHNVTLVDVSEDVLKNSKSKIETSLARVVKKLFGDNKEKGELFQKETMGRLNYRTSLVDSVNEADLVVEAVVENIDIKHKVFTQLDSVAPEHTIFASNTSSFLIKDMAKVTKRLDRFGGLHFFNPVTVMKLVEVIKMPETSQETHEALIKFGTTMGKTAVEAKDKDGFIVNRLLIPYLMDSVRMLERGDATARDIDTAMKLGSGHPMGPIELVDYIGLDTCKFALDGWHQKEPNNPTYRPIAMLDKLVSEGKLGVKTGAGFYEYKKK